MDNVSKLFFISEYIFSYKNQVILSKFLMHEN